MEIKKVLAEYDALFPNTSPDGIHAFLAEHIRTAEEEGDRASLLTLLNEQIGYARDTDRKDIVVTTGSRILSLLDEMKSGNTLACGKAVLNVANSYRACGKYAESEELFCRTEAIYRKAVGENTFEYAWLYNNWSLLYLAQGMYHEAIRKMRCTMDIIDRHDDATIQQATTRANLAQAILVRAKTENSAEAEVSRAEARQLLEEAVALHEAEGGQDYHYGAVLAAIADMQSEDGLLAEAAENYRRAKEIIRMYVGENRNYKILSEKEKRAAEADSRKGRSSC